MKVLFLDIDGVLNSSAFFDYEQKRRKRDNTKCKRKLSETLDPVLCNNLQILLNRYKDLKIVISSYWRTVFPLEYIKEIFEENHIDTSRIIGKTVDSKRIFSRNDEIQGYLEDNKQILSYMIVDDINDGFDIKHFVQTDERDGLTLSKVNEIIDKIKKQKD